MKREEEISWRLTIVKVFIHYQRASLVQSVIKGNKKVQKYNKNKKYIYISASDLFHLKGTVTQNIFSLKSGPKGCKGL